MSDNCLSEIAFNTLPQAVRDWIHEIGWERENVRSCHMKYKIIKTNASDKEWKQWKNGRNVEVIISNGEQKYNQKFIRLNDIEWKKKV